MLKTLNINEMIKEGALNLNFGFWRIIKDPIINKYVVQPANWCVKKCGFCGTTNVITMKSD